MANERGPLPAGFEIVPTTFMAKVERDWICWNGETWQRTFSVNEPFAICMHQNRNIPNFAYARPARGEQGVLL